MIAVVISVIFITIFIKNIKLRNQSHLTDTEPVYEEIGIIPQKLENVDRETIAKSDSTIKLEQNSCYGDMSVKCQITMNSCPAYDTTQKKSD